MNDATILRLRDRVMALPRRPLVMGILNLNDDSFCGDGTLDGERALERARRMVAEGADILDVGGESARTNRAAISVEEEAGRVGPFVKAFLAARADWLPRDPAQVWPPVLSVNTWRPEAVRRLAAAGAEMVNDMGGLPTDENARIAAESGAALLIMHTRGEPKVPHRGARYDDILEDMGAFFREKMAIAAAAGVPAEGIVLDPGLDFAKERADNLRVLRGLEGIVRLGRPVLVPVSRKTVIGEVLNLPDPAERDAGTIACLVAAALRGGAIFRVHNVAASASAVRIVDAVWTAGLEFGG